MHPGDQPPWQEKAYLHQYFKENNEAEQSRHSWSTIMVNAREFWGSMWETVQGVYQEKCTSGCEKEGKDTVAGRAIRGVRSMLGRIFRRESRGRGK